MRIDKLRVYDYDESLIASGYAMRTELEDREPNEKDYKRGRSLTKASNGNGAHGQWLTGVRVNFDLTCTIKMWTEIERYRFMEFVTSQSTMHRIAKFDIDTQCNEYVEDAIIAFVNKLKDDYNSDPTPEKYLKLLYNVPVGFELTARMTTNYRSLLNIYVQRHDHRLPEWREFCQYMLDTLPNFKDLVKAYYEGGLKDDPFRNS